MSYVTKFIIRDDSSEFDLNHLFNSISLMSINTPTLADTDSKQDSVNESEDPSKLLEIIKTINGVEKVLRLTTVNQTEKAKQFKTLTHL
jgi:hypothetical protein